MDTCILFGIAQGHPIDLQEWEVYKRNKNREEIMARLTTVIVCLCIMLLIYMTELGLVFCDLRAGIRKAKEKGIYRTSEGYRRTIDKIARYFNMTFALSLVDVVMLAIVFFLYYFYTVDIWMIPVFTMIAGGYVAFVEIKSIWEPADIKEKKLLKDYSMIVMKLLKEYGSIEKVTERIAEMAIQQEQKENDIEPIDNSDI